LNNQAFAVNSDLIKFIENAPDTVVTLTNGEKIVVLETSELVIERVIDFRRAVLSGLLSASVDPNTALANLKNPETEPQSHLASKEPSLG
jgi:flagellar protein FlbD